MNDMYDMHANGCRGRRRAGLARRAGVLAAAVAGIALLAAACGGSPAGNQPGSSSYQDALTYAQCMRGHGFPNFPDPLPGGGFELRNINPNSPQFQSAARACGKSGGPGAGRSPAQLHQMMSQLLKYSACMRADGIRNFPDPTEGNGGVGISVSGGRGGGKIDPNSPQFQAAQQACRHLMPNSGGSS